MLEGESYSLLPVLDSDELATKLVQNRVSPASSARYTRKGVMGPLVLDKFADWLQARAASTRQHPGRSGGCGVSK